MNALRRAWARLLDIELKKKDAEAADPWRPRLHIAPPVGWLNDPNGLCQYRGVYHAFYQMAPFEPEGGLKFWGHCTSTDLLHWKFQGIPLMPDEPFDCHGAYSGSALVEEDKMYLFYTGNIKLSGDYDYVNNGRISNTLLAVSEDGLQANAKELLMSNGDYPKDLTCHVRDPKVWKQDGVYYMIQGARTKEDKGVALLFASEDKRNWNYVRRLESEKLFGYMWECPDLYELDGRTVLSISPQGVEQDGLRYANRYQSVTCFLDGDIHTGKPEADFRELDGGFDFYAPQTFLADDGRRIQIGWLGMPDVPEHVNPTVSSGWQNMLTLPRELSVRDGVVCQNPVRELDQWWNKELRFQELYEGETDACYELELDDIQGDVNVTLAGGLTLGYDTSDRIFRMEFTDQMLGGGRTFRGRKLDRLDCMRVIVDASCVEVYINGGTDVFTTRFYPMEDQYRVRAEGASLRGRLRTHEEHTP